MTQPPSSQLSGGFWLLPPPPRPPCQDLGVRSPGTEMLVCVSPPPPWDANISASSWGKSKGQLLTGVNQLNPILCPNFADLFGFAPTRCNLGGVGTGKASFGLVQAWAQASLVWGHHQSIRPAVPRRWPDPAQGSHSKHYGCRVTVPQQ